jgi:hypothetical protein
MKRASRFEEVERFWRYPQKPLVTKTLAEVNE